VTDDVLAASAADDRLLSTLERLLDISEPELGPALGQASTLVAEALAADKVDVFLYRPDIQSLVAVGSSDTPMGRRQRAIGLDRQPLANGGRAVLVYESGVSNLSTETGADPEELRGVIDGLGVRSQIVCPMAVGNEPRGVLSAMADSPGHFDERDLHFLEAVARWVGMVAHRAELVDRIADEATRRGRRAAAEELARLTIRQQEVAALIAAGFSNEEIAAQLSLVPGTVANHVEAILRRLVLRNRTQIATWAVEHGVYGSGGEDN
jgi:two-component system, OmpR family, sensor kinase